MYKLHKTSPYVFSHHKFYRVALLKTLKPGDKQTLSVEITASHLLELHPAEIWQSERQLVRFFGSAHLFSPYLTNSAGLSLQLSSANVVAYSRQPEPVDKREAAINYGPYKELPPYSEVSCADFASLFLCAHWY